MGPLGGDDLPFRSPQLGTSLYCETTDTGLVYRVLRPFTSQPKLVLIHQPRGDGRLSRRNIYSVLLI